MRHPLAPEREPRTGRRRRGGRGALAVVAGAAVAVASLGAAPAPTAAGSGAETRTSFAAPRSAAERDDLLRRWVADTWRSMAAMVDPATGLPADNVGAGLDAASRAAYTSPTNIGSYLWSTVVARDTGLISADEAYQRMRQTVQTVATLEHHTWSGQFYNWYDPHTGAKLLNWPETGEPLKPFLSSVDNGWLATGLLVARNAEPRLRAEADAIRRQMNFGMYYNPAENQIRGGFWDDDPQDPAAVVGNYLGAGPDVWYTGHHYGAFNTEPRMASYLGIAAGDIPRKHYFGTFRTFPPSCDWSWTETQGIGRWRTYLGQEVFEGAYPYRGMKIVPSWGGSMFEALMVPLFVPEERWGQRSWGVNHPLYVRGQIEHGLEEADYGYWGFSPSNNPAGGYREYGVDQLGMDDSLGYTSDQEKTLVTQPYGDCRAGAPPPESFGDGVVTPHASFLALRYAPRAAVRNLVKLSVDFDAYGAGGFYDAIAVRSGQVSQRYLSLDQGMVMAALGNALAGDDLRGYVSSGALAQSVKPLMAREVFGAAP